MATLRPDATAVLRDKAVRRSMPRYFAVVQNDRPAKFTIARKIASSYSKQDSLEELWKVHKQLLTNFSQLEKKIHNRQEPIDNLETPLQSFLDLKIEIANRILGNCQLCRRQCKINRNEGKLGYCKCGKDLAVASIFQHMGEEPELVPSGTIFTLGCTMRCRHCQNWSISQWMETGEICSIKHLAGKIEQLRRQGCRNANLVGGDPTPWLPKWLQTFKHVNTNVPVVWNSNAYYSDATRKLLAGFVDLYLLDFKYGNDKCATRISEAPNYWKTCTTNHMHAKRFGELLVRILVLPSHLDCCVKPILEWINKEIGPSTRTNIMFQYRPEWRAHEIPELRRRLTTEEKRKATELARKAGLVNFIT